MKMRLKKTLIFFIILLVLLYVAFRFFAPPIVEKSLNKQLAYEALQVSKKASELHSKLTIMDWHSDTMLWARDVLALSDYGHVDLPRLNTAGVATQMFTVVTKSPSGQNYDSNKGETLDNITLLAIAQGWPIRTWSSLFERAVFQAEKLNDAVSRSEGAMRFIKSQSDLTAYMGADDRPLAVLLGLEGAHPLEGKLENIDKLYDAGFRMMGLTHFFDNELGGSLHGQSKAGLTDFGKAAVQRMEALGIIIDLSHASEAAAEDVLAIASRPPVVSHTGFWGACSTPRNFNDTLMEKIAARGGLIAIGFWNAAVCNPTPQGIARAIKYGIALVGVDHLALGSDWDGSVETISSDALPQLTQALLNEGISEDDIAKIMGENSMQFLQKWLPVD